MNVESVKAAAGNAARKTAKPRVIVDLLTVLSVLLTVLAALPYQLGDISGTFPPSWKPGLTLAGIIASTLLAAIRPYMKSPNQPSEPPSP